MFGQRFILSVTIACAGLALCCSSCCTRQSSYESPESFIVDPDTGTYYVSNVNRARPKTDEAEPKAEDNNGYITTVDKDLNVVKLKLAQGGRDGVTLNDPRGMAIVGDTLWVADKKDVRGFDKKTGKNTANIPLTAHGARLLNDVAAGPDGVIFVCDKGANKIFRIATRPNREVTTLAEGEDLNDPNGLCWNAEDELLYVACWSGSVILTVNAEGEVSTFVSAPDQFAHLDGIDRDKSGSFYVSDYHKGVIYRITPEKRIDMVVGKLNAPADISIDHANNRLLIPLLASNRITTHDLGNE